MKINIIIPGIGLSGGIRVLFRYAELLNEKNHDVVFYTPLLAYDVKNSNSEILNKIHVVSNSLKRINTYKVKKSQNTLEFNVKVIPVPTICDRYVRDADICIASAWPTAFSVANLSLTKGKKVYFIQDYEIWNNEEFGKKSYTLPLKHIVISTWIKNKLVEQLGSDDAVIVYDGLDLEVFNNQTRINTFDYAINILMLYHDLPKKGVRDGIEVYKSIKVKYPNVKLTMFGLPERPNISDEVEYYQNPSRDQLRELYNKANIFLYTSREEGWGLTPLEAMASKCVVVGTNTGCMLDIGEDKVNAMLCCPGDISEMKKKLCTLIENQELLQALSEKGYETVQKFSWANAVAQLKRELEIIWHEGKN